MDNKPDNIDNRTKAIMEILKEIYNEKVAFYSVFPEYVGKTDDPDGYGKVTGPCGDTIEIFLKVDGDVIQKATFLTDGCTTSVATANAGISLIMNKALMNARSITPEKILEELGGLPERDQHCALLAANTIRAAVLDYDKNVRQPWRKLYRKI